jgi:hypothetical protein
MAICMNYKVLFADGIFCSEHDAESGSSHFELDGHNLLVINTHIKWNSSLFIGSSNVLNKHIYRSIYLLSNV